MGIAVIGAGYWGPNLIRNLLCNADTELRWVCDVYEERAAKAVGHYSHIRVTDLVDDVLEDPEVEGVAIATPAATHHDIAMAALRAGKHLLVEKPLAATVAQGREIVELAAERGLVLMCDHTYCYTPAVQRIRELVASGTLGELLYVDSVRINLGLVQKDIDVLWDLAPHDLSILNFILPPEWAPTAVSAHGADPLSTGRACVGYLTLTLGEGAMAHIHVNWLSPTKIRTMVIGGSRRTLVWDDLNPSQRLSVFDRGVDVEAHVDEERRREIFVSYRLGDMIAPSLVEAEALQSQIDQIDAQVAGVPPGERDALRSSLAARRDSLASQQGLFRQRMDELRVDSGLKSSEVQLVAVASAPTSPVKPTPVRNALLALVVGALLGVGVASLMEYLDDSVRSADDVARLTGMPVLGTVPTFRERKPDPVLVPDSPVEEKDASAREAYRSLRTSVQLLGVPRAVSTIQFTSAGPSEGKTTTVANLAVAMAASGRTVVVVDADLRRPRMHDVFGVANDAGLTSVVLGDLPLVEALQPVPFHEGLTTLTAGSLPHNPSELLSLKRTSEVIFQLESQFDVVLIDSAPVLPVTDSIVLSTWVQAVVVLAAVGLTKRRQLRAAVQLLEQAQAPVVGSVVVRTVPETKYGYEYYRRPDAPAGGGARRRPVPDPPVGGPAPPQDTPVRPDRGAGSATPVGDQP